MPTENKGQIKQPGAEKWQIFFALVADLNGL